MTERMTAADLQAFYKAEGDHHAPRQDREGPIHRAIIAFLDFALPRDAVYHHSPNELDMAGPEAARQIAKARKLGTRKGWPDIEIIRGGRVWFLEVKAGSNMPDETQTECHEALYRAGCYIAVVRSVDDAEAVLRRWEVI